MKLQVMGTVLLLTLSQLSFSATPKPDACPSVSALQAIGVNTVIEENGFWYGGVNSANYGTSVNWSMAMGEFQAKNQDDAKSQMIATLNSLTLEYGPVPFKFNEKDVWVCYYKDQSGHTAGTFTPTMNFTSYLHTSFKF